MAGANTIPSPYMPIAAPIFSLGTIRYTIDSVTTGRIPPGMAWTTRKTTRLSRSQATPQSADPAAKPSSARW
jgi:hypothetical protein